MNFNIVTLFPEMITEALKPGVVGQGLKNHRLRVINPRHFTTDVHQSVDGRPFGGGDGMVMAIDPLEKSILSLGQDRGYVVYLSPQGRPWTDQRARQWAESKTSLTLICGRYAGVDQRFINAYVDEEISIGDYILSGGELAALVLIDSLVRYLPGTLGNPLSPLNESFSEGFLEGPSFTRPKEHLLGQVPEVLTSGHHQKVSELKQALAVVKTHLVRPDLRSRQRDENILRRSIKKLLELSEEELKTLGLRRDEICELE